MQDAIMFLSQSDESRHELPKCVLPVFCGAEESHPGIRGPFLTGRREVHGFRETREQQLQQLHPDQTNT